MPDRTDAQLPTRPGGDPDYGPGIAGDENKIGWWNWRGGVIVYHKLKPPYALPDPPPPARRHATSRLGWLIATALILLAVSLSQLSCSA
jgi:hypothetical protein